jgi:hydroxyacylglutathione hydrolase
MIIEKSMNSDWLSNTYLVADKPGGQAVLVDSGGPSEPILQKIEELGVKPTHILCTHHHVDHISNNDLFRSRFDARICGHKEERHLFGHLDVELDDGQELVVGELSIKALHIPGHTVGQLAYLINGEAVFTGDTLFKSTIGGTRAPGHTTYGDIRRSIMEILMKLPKELSVRPGHMGPTTVGDEWEKNPFIRMWRGLEPEGNKPCTAMGQPATLVLRAPDYDGGTKCWVRFAEGRKDDIVPGSAVKD